MTDEEKTKLVDDTLRQMLAVGQQVYTWGVLALKAKYGEEFVEKRLKKLHDR